MSLPPIYCVNMASDTERRRRMEARFEFHGLTNSVRFVEAFTPEHPDVRRVAPELSRTTLREVACLFSHLAALRAFLNDTSQSTRGAIVMEDDVALHNAFGVRLESVMANVPTGTPLVCLGYSVWDWTGATWAGVESWREDLATVNPEAVWGCLAYWISRDEAVRAIARLARPFTELPDWVTSEAIIHTRHALLAHPALALTESFDSNLVEAHEIPSRLASHRQSQRWFSFCDYGTADRANRQATIALCMIVKNEAAVIERCLMSVRHLIDSWVICDTGSTDDTMEVIQRCLSGLPGALHRSDWVDFGHNRSEVLRLARGTADYLLLLDADQTISEVGLLPPFTEGSADAFRLRHHDGIEYDVERLVRGSLPWRYEGRTHEYLTCDDTHDEDGITRQFLDAWEVIHHGDGGSRSVKFERDRVLLERTLDEQPDDPRATFYLAQTLETLGQRREARDAYLRRAQLGSFEEEAWYAQWRAAAMIDDDPSTALGEFMAAWERRPTRLEPLYDAVLLCEREGWWSQAKSLTTTGIGIERPDDILFLHAWLYESGMRAAHDRVTEAIRGAVASETPNEIVHDDARLEDLIPDVAFAHVALDVPSGWSAFNPSIATHGNELTMIVRSSNYKIRPDGSYHILHHDEVRTENHFIRLDAELGVIDSRPIIDRSGREAHPTAVRGLEDCRPFWFSGEWRFVATTRDSRPDSLARMALGALDLSGSDEVAVTRVHVLPAALDHVNEKNWVPWVHDGRLHLVRAWLPREVLVWDDRHAALTLAEDRTDRVDRARWRGSSQGISIAEGTLFVVHEVEDRTGGRRYLHRFVLIDSAGNTNPSTRFTLTGSRIEFVAGLARRNDEILISFGVSDTIAALALVPLDTVVEACGMGSRVEHTDIA